MTGDRTGGCAASKAERMNSVNSKNTPEAIRRLTDNLIARYNGL